MAWVAYDSIIACDVISDVSPFTDYGKIPIYLACCNKPVIINVT